MNDQDYAPPRAKESPRAIAWTALLFALIACGVSGFTLLYTYEDGKYLENFREVRGEIKEGIGHVIEQIDGDEQPATGANTGAPQGGDGFNWDNIRERVDRIQEMASTGDERANAYLDVLRKDLGLIRDYASEKTSGKLKTLEDQLGEVQGTVKEDAASASTRLKEISASVAAWSKGERPKTSTTESEATPAGNVVVHEKAASEDEVKVPPPPVGWDE